MPGPGRVIFIIRHGEKPTDDSGKSPPFGVKANGKHDVHSLITQGWERAGALAALFAPFHAVPRSGLLTPTELIAPDYGDPKKTAAHRTHETISALSAWIDVKIKTPYAEGSEKQLGQKLAAADTGVTLVCWEHKAIQTIAEAIVPPGVAIPAWPDDRFDVVFTFTWDTTTSAYVFGQVPQMVLAGDVDAPIGSLAPA